MAGRKRTTPPPVEHPALARTLMEMGRALDRRADAPESAPSYLDLVELVASAQVDLDDLLRTLVHYARRYESVTWEDVASRLGVTRQTAYYRFGTPSPNDVGAEA